jgi:hypothetical protein
MIRVVNVIPAGQSGESSLDAEPTIAVDPAQPRTIVVSTTTTPAVVDGAGTSRGQLFVSHDGGLAWQSDPILTTAGTGDITLDYAGIVSAGWNLKQGDRFFVLDLGGDGADELVVVSPNGQWIGILGEWAGAVAATWIGFDWVNSPGGTGAEGWNLREGDQFYVADVDNDGRDELVVLSPDEQWIGVLREDNGGLAVGWIGHDWVNSPGGSGAEGWNLRQGDQFHVADIDGDGSQELVVLSPDEQWIGVLRENNGGLAAGWIGFDWVQPPTPQSALYAGTLDPGTGTPVATAFNVLRTFNVDDPNPMTTLERTSTTTKFQDQPWVAEAKVDGEFRAFVGFNDLNHTPRTASVEVFRRSNSAQPSSAVARLERRSPPVQDGPSVRVAAHPGGRVYAAFMSWTAQGTTVAGITPITVDVVVTRDDEGGLSRDPFGALLDPGDSNAGNRLVTGVSLRFTGLGGLGTDRIGSDLAIAVDPNDSSTVYVAWCDDVTTPPATTPTYTLHVQKSTDGGQTWPLPELRTLGNARNPALAVSDLGTVGFMFQQFTPPGPAGGVGTWVTHFQRGTQQGTSWTDFTLASAPASGWQGDYLQLKAVGSNFFGVFSADNTPLTANFPQGITYGRNANFTTGGLLAADKTTAVAVSIDPFFVKVTEPPDETNVQVTCRNLDETGRIAEIGGSLQGGGSWKLSVPDVISRIDDNGQRFFVTGPGGTEVDVITATGPRGRRYLKTVADTTTADNLRSLPACP